MKYFEYIFFDSRRMNVLARLIDNTFIMHEFIFFVFWGRSNGLYNAPEALPRRTHSYVRLEHN